MPSLKTTKTRNPLAVCVAARGALLVAIALGVLLGAARPGHAQSEAVLYKFAGIPDGANPMAGLTPDGAGNFFGTTIHGGVPCAESSQGCGTVFELSPNGGGGWSESVLYSFTGGADGAFPSPLVRDSSGNLYGTTNHGGSNGFGVVFQLSFVKSSWVETVLYNFCSEQYCADGELPSGGLMMDSSGNLYGSVWGGVFELSPSGGSWTERIIYGQTGSVDPSANLIMDPRGNIFGVGAGLGVRVFELSPDGKGGWNGTVIHNFPEAGNYYSNAGTLALDKAGNLYGALENIRRHGMGYIYELSPGKKGRWREKILHTFKGGRDPSSYTAVVLDAGGNIYGTTYSYVYELVASNGYQLKNLGAVNTGNDLIMDSAGNLFGTSVYGGLQSQDGYVFEITP